MVSAKEIQATCEDIIREFAPQQVILFGFLRVWHADRSIGCRSVRRDVRHEIERTGGSLGDEKAHP